MTTNSGARMSPTALARLNIVMEDERTGGEGSKRGWGWVVLS